jgi:asparagine synthase (glutamine-hydrolysing)
MCGIFAFLSKDDRHSAPFLSYQFGKRVDEMRRAASRIRHRGPDETREFLTMNNGLGAFLVFHRLAINDLSPLGAQPMVHPDDNGIVMICNGEIYNHRELASEYNLKTQSHSDCEVILHLYRQLGFAQMIAKLKGYFAMVLVDFHTQQFWIARDPIGVRSLFMANMADGAMVVASEAKALTGIHASSLTQVSPGTFIEGRVGVPYLSYNSFIKQDLPTIRYEPSIVNQLVNEWSVTIRNHLIQAVRRCLTITDRPVGCLLSGGLDSSLIAGIAAAELRARGQRLRTFSVGMTGSTDLRYAREVAAFLDTDHTELVVTADELLKELPATIYQIETCDTTTVRASTPMFLLCRRIKATTDIAVILSGEGSDEVCGSYMYFHNAPSPLEFDEECARLISNLSYYDVLRCDKCTAGSGLEVRVPFLNEDFRNFYMSIPPLFRMPSKWGIEKYLLRKAFADTGTIPESVIWRPKEGMSDGVSSQSRSWYQIIQEHAASQLQNRVIADWGTDMPKTTEARWFREIFNEHFDEFRYDVRALFRKYWLPKWSGDIVEPSARVLSVYKNQ